MVDPSVLGISWKRQLWHKWKALRAVPFRSSWFVGYDLEGNSYWEVKDHNNPSRLRRKVSLDRPYFHFSDFKPHPQWMQWLQFTRPGPPTLDDLANDAKRQYRLKILAQNADRKWKSLPLKSQQSSGEEDPRISSSWQGSAPAESAGWGQDSSSARPSHEPDTDPSASEPDGADANASLLAAMEKAQSRRKQEPKVVRDNLGQVKFEKESEKKTEST